MALDKTIHTPNKQRDPSDDAGGPVEPEESSLLQQAKGYSEVARDALADCDRGEDALTQMHKRRNRSGQ